MFPKVTIKSGHIHKALFLLNTVLYKNVARYWYGPT